MELMDFPLKDAVGFLAAILTTSAFLPQVIKAWRTRSTKDVSVGMFLALVIGICVNAGDKMHRYAGVKMHQ